MMTPSDQIDFHKRFRDMPSSRAKAVAKLDRFCRARGWSLAFRAIHDSGGELGTGLIDIAIEDQHGNRVPLECSGHMRGDWVLNQAASLLTVDLQHVLTEAGLIITKPVKPSRKQLPLPLEA